MYKIKTLNNISPVGLSRLPADNYVVSDDAESPDALLLRSFKLHGVAIDPSIKAVGRAGAGTNNIPVDEYSARGIPVFNAPGANANAVKELVLAGMLLAARNIGPALSYVNALTGEDDVISKEVEAGKKKFVGYELPGRTLGVIGLGAIGVKIANAAIALGMNVVGFDPGLTVRSAWQLDSNAKQAANLDEVFASSDFITFHVPLNEHTKGLLNKDKIELMKDGAVVMNFARGGIVEEQAVMNAIESGKLHGYVCDFPSKSNIGKAGVIALPHLGASTGEAEENCAVMVADQVREFLEDGNVINSVNFPEVYLPRSPGASRVTIVNANVPNMVGQISTTLAKAGLNIADMINKARGQLAYTVVDVDSTVPEATVTELANIEGVLNVRVIG